MSVYVIAQGKVENQELLGRYEAEAERTITAHGGRLLAYSEKATVIEGTMFYPRTVVVEFPSMEAFRTWYDSPEYRVILPWRLGSVHGSLIVAQGANRE